MKKSALVFLFIFAVVPLIAAEPAANQASPDWAMNATIIEACTCPMFCQCYFNTQPAEHHTHEGHAERYCKGNLAYRINRGNYGATKLDGAKFWLAGDIGNDFTKGEANWGILTFDPSVTKDQRAGIMAILPHIYPMKWKSMEVAKDAPIAWQATKDSAIARLDEGKAGEIVLGAAPGMTSDPVVIRNLRYIGAPRNDGFILMPNSVEAYRLGDKAFETKGTNGFMITVDINSKDPAPEMAQALGSASSR